MNRFSLIAVAVALSSTACAQTFVTDKPMVHDPVMAKEGDTYYMMSTGRGLQMAESKDLR